MSTIIQTFSNLYLLSFLIKFLLRQKLHSVLSNYANYLCLVSSHNVLASQLNTHSRLLNQPVSPSSAIMKCVWYCRLLAFSRKPSKLAYRKILCDTATTVVRVCLEKEEKSIQVSFLHLVPRRRPSYPLFCFRFSPCATRYSRLPARGRNKKGSQRKYFDESPRTHTRPSFRKNSTPRRVLCDRGAV